MPSEPIEAEFAYPPALSSSQEEEYRELDQEGPLSGTATVTNTRPPSLSEVEAAFSKEGIYVVNFEKGMGEDPREWPRLKKWSVLPIHFYTSLSYRRCRYVTLSTGFLCLAVASGSAIITGECVSFFTLLSSQAEPTTQP